MIISAIERLLHYGIQNGFFVESDLPYIRNRVIEVLKLEQYELRPEIHVDWEQEELLEAAGAEYVLRPVLDFAAEQKIIPEDTLTYRDLLSSALMGAMMDRPSAIIRTFQAEYEKSPEAAVLAFYKMNIASDYIKSSRNAKNLIWKADSEFGALDITVNLSKPEKDPKEILAERNAVKSNYPMCLLCRENEGYMGRVNHPGRQNLRVLPVELNHESWFFQYSPYAYYNEHCIVFSEQHIPMAITPETFKRLLGFVQWMPHYFVGSNADLPIVGGSILSHDHFQGGCYEFPMDLAKTVAKYKHDKYKDVSAEFLKWPLSVVRLKSGSIEVLSQIAAEILAVWRGYSDAENEIEAFTGDVPHNTITPVARFKNGLYELDLVLRNNRTSEAHPEGIFHPHRHIHGIKKENIGLIEVMGLAVLPGRLKQEMVLMASKLCGVSLNEADEALIEKHAAFLTDVKGRKDNKGLQTTDEVLELVQTCVGEYFAEGLNHCGVFKQNEVGQSGMTQFMKQMGWHEVF